MCPDGNAGGGLIRNKTSYVFDKGIYIFFSVADPKLIVGTEIRKAESYWLNPGTFGSIATKIVFWFSNLVSYTGYGLDFYFYIWSGYFPFTHSVSHKIIINLMTLTYKVIMSQFCKWELKSSCRQGCFFLEVLVEIPFPVYTSYWMNSVSCGYRAAFPVFLLAVN